jgi:serine phosphatase RsbU (regulator of sigma subunit)
MQVLNRSKSRKFRDKEKTLQEEEEALKKSRHLEKLSQKNNLIKAEFEKHKKRLLLSVSDMSKTFEAQVTLLAIFSSCFS